MTVPQLKKEWLKEQLDKMDESEHTQIFSIVKNYTTNYTKTQGGVLISTTNLSDDCLKEIENYVIFCLDQRRRMDDDMKTRKNYERLIHD